MRFVHPTNILHISRDALDAYRSGGRSSGTLAQLSLGLLGTSGRRDDGDDDDDDDATEMLRAAGAPTDSLATKSLLSDGRKQQQQQQHHHASAALGDIAAELAKRENRRQDGTGAGAAAAAASASSPAPPPNSNGNGNGNAGGEDYSGEVTTRVPMPLRPIMSLADL